MLIIIIFATLVVGLISLIGLFFFFNKIIKPEFLRSLISLAAGSLLAVSFLDLLPEAVEKSQFKPHVIFETVLLSIMFFFLFERVLHWHHCRCELKDLPCAEGKKNLIFLNLSGDGVHNLIDGFLIAAAFMLDTGAGIALTIAIIVHEVPQEISDFGVLLYGGLTKPKALFYNFLTALTAVLGAVVFYFFGQSFENLIPLMAAFAAGNFIYLATADLIPELHHETDPKIITLHSLWLVVGVIAILLISLLIPNV